MIATPIWVTLLALLLGLAVRPLFSWLASKFLGKVGDGAKAVEALAQDPADAAKVDALNHNFDNAFLGAVGAVGGDIAAMDWNKIVPDAIANARAMLTPDLEAEIAALMRIGGDRLVEYLKARYFTSAFHLQQQTAGKVLAVPVSEMAFIDSLSPAGRRAMIAIKGAPADAAPSVQITNHAAKPPVTL